MGQLLVLEDLMILGIVICYKCDWILGDLKISLVSPLDIGTIIRVMEFNILRGVFQITLHRPPPVLRKLMTFLKITAIYCPFETIKYFILKSENLRGDH
jgi:hypothetical protein